MRNGLYTGIPESTYHADDLGTDEPTLSVSIAQALVLESPAHAYLRHPRLGGQPFSPTNIMDRGSLIHSLLLGKGRELAIVECDDWKKPGNRELRDQHRAEGRLAVTRKLYDESIVAAQELEKRLRDKGFAFSGDSEVTMLWEERATNGNRVRCRGRFDHVVDADVWDLKITGDANPKTARNQIVRMGYDIQGTAYPRALADVCPHLRGRVRFTVLFCEPEPPYCVTPMRFAGSMRERGGRAWQRGVDTWERCLRTGRWPDYTDSVVFAEAKPWEIDEEVPSEEDHDEHAA